MDVKRWSVLVVDDDENNLKLIGEILARAGYISYQATSGQEGITLAQAHCPNVVLMDLAMPNLDGFETTRLLKRHPATAAIPVIACSALVTKEFQQQALQAGCEGYITKPLDPNHLVAQVTKLIFASTQARN